MVNSVSFCLSEKLFTLPSNLKDNFSEWSIFFFLKILFLAVLGLCCGTRASPCSGFSCCGAWALGAWASVVVARGLSSCGSRALERRLTSCGARA